MLPVAVGPWASRLAILVGLPVSGTVIPKICVVSADMTPFAVMPSDVVPWVTPPQTDAGSPWANCATPSI